MMDIDKISEWIDNLLDSAVFFLLRLLILFTILTALIIFAFRIAIGDLI